MNDSLLQVFIFLFFTGALIFYHNGVAVATQSTTPIDFGESFNKIFVGKTPFHTPTETGQVNCVGCQIAAMKVSNTVYAPSDITHLYTNEPQIHLASGCSLEKK